MTWRPVARIIARPAVLPAFNPTWATPCMRCAHRAESVAQGLRCTQTPMIPTMHGMIYSYCIDARDPGGVCGPDAALFVEVAA